jgi:hypothetical protein
MHNQGRKHYLVAREIYPNLDYKEKDKYDKKIYTVLIRCLITL